MNISSMGRILAMTDSMIFTKRLPASDMSASSFGLLQRGAEDDTSTASKK